MEGGRPLGRAWARLLLILATLLGGSITVVPVGAAPQQPFGGAPAPIPGVVEVEDYDLGGEGVGYHDTTAGNNGGQYRSDDVDIWRSGVAAEGFYVGANATGEWREYTVEVAAAGAYTLDIRVATPKSGKRIHVEFGGIDLTGPIAVPNTGGWQAWQTLSVPATLAAGTQTMRLVTETGGMNLNRIEFRAGGGPTQVARPTISPNGGALGPSDTVTLATTTAGATIHYTLDGSTPTVSSPVYTGGFTLLADATVKAIASAAGLADSAVASATFTVSSGGGTRQPFGGVPAALPGVVEFEDYDRGGEGLAYHDTTAGNKGGQYRTDDVDIWRAGVAAEGLYVGANAAGEWREYTVDVAAAGAYTLDIRLATPKSGKRLHVAFDGIDVTGALTVPNTGGWQAWQTLSVPVTLTAGTQIMRLVAETGGMNLNRVEVLSVGPPQPVVTPAISPDGGAVSASDPISLSTATAGATIHFTLDGTEPTRAAPTYSDPFTLPADATVKAFAVASGRADSAIASAAFTVTPGTVATPTISPHGGAILDTDPISLSTATPGASIRYTLDGTDPSGTSVAYTRPFTLQADATVKAIARGPGAADSAIASATFTVTQAPVATPVISPNGGAILNTDPITLSTTTSGASIHYTLDGTAPTSASPVYTRPFTLPTNATVKAFAKADGLTDSGVASAAFTVSSAGGSQQPFGGTPAPLPGRIEAEDYDLGGEGVAYHDTTAGNKGTTYRGDDVDLWLSPKVGEGLYVGANAKGEWREYTVDAGGSGDYLIDLRVATPKNDKRVHLEFGGVDLTGPVAIPNTGGWQNWQTVTVPVTLTAGQQVMRVVIDTSGLSLNWMDVRAVLVLPPAAAPSFSRAKGEYTGSVTVSLDSTTPGASILYTVDGTEPDNASPLYTGSFPLTRTGEVKAIAVADGFAASAVSSRFYKIVPAGTPALRPLAANKAYWSFKGQPTLLLGGFFQDNPFQWAGLDYNFLVQQLDLLVAVGGNYVRNAVTVRNLAFPNFDDTGMAYPFVRTAGGLYDLDQWNPEYWSRLDTFLAETALRNVVVQLELWDQEPLACPWGLNPFNPKNNINYDTSQVSVPSSGGFAKRLVFFSAIPQINNDTVLMAYQNRYIAKLLEISLQYDHVIYQVKNEYDMNPAVADYWATFLYNQALAAGRHVYVASSPSLFPTSYTSTQFSVSHRNLAHPINNPLLFSFGDLSTNSGGLGEDMYLNQLTYRNAQNQVLRRPLNYTKSFAFLQPVGVRWQDRTAGDDFMASSRLWRAVLGGAASFRFHRDTFNGAAIPVGGVGLNPLAQTHLSSMRMLLGAIDVFSMEPSNDLLSQRSTDEAFAMSDGGDQYVVYFTGQGDGQIGLDLSGSSGTLQLNWLDIANKAWQPGLAVSGGAVAVLTPPGPGQWALVLKP